MKITVNASRVTILLRDGHGDRISIEFAEGMSPFPSMGYAGSAEIDTASGLGLEWCRKHLGVEPEVIDARHPPRPLPAMYQVAADATLVCDYCGNLCTEDRWKVHDGWGLPPQSNFCSKKHAGDLAARLNPVPPPTGRKR